MCQRQTEVEMLCRDVSWSSSSAAAAAASSLFLSFSLSFLPAGSARLHHPFRRLCSGHIFFFFFSPFSLRFAPLFLFFLLFFPWSVNILKRGRVGWLRSGAQCWLCLSPLYVFLPFSPLSRCLLLTLILLPSPCCFFTFFSSGFSLARLFETSATPWSSSASVFPVCAAQSVNSDTNCASRGVSSVSHHLTSLDADYLLWYVHRKIPPTNDKSIRMT